MNESVSGADDTIRDLYTASHRRAESAGSVLLDVLTPRTGTTNDADKSSGDDELARVISHRMRTDPESLSLFVVYDDTRPVAAAWTLYFRTIDGRFAPFAGLYGGATIPEYRRRGLYTALVFARAREALEREIPYLVVDAGAMSEAILGNLGFRRIAAVEPAVAPTSATR
ncbi:MAG: GNAT family N-acetyltransferase [Alkalispirochaeta sp.]